MGSAEKNKNVFVSILVVACVAVGTAHTTDESPSSGGGLSIGLSLGDSGSHSGAPSSGGSGSPSNGGSGSIIGLSIGDSGSQSGGSGGNTVGLSIGNSGGSHGGHDSPAAGGGLSIGIGDSAAGGGILSPIPVTLKNINEAIAKTHAAFAKKSVNDICASTEYTAACEKALTRAKNTSDPKSLIKVGFTTTVDNIHEAISKSVFLKEAAKDPRTAAALDTCNDLLQNSIDDLTRSFHKADNFNLITIKDYANDLKVWLTAAITHQQTCIDAFDDTKGDAGEIINKFLRFATELTSNGLAMTTQFIDFLKGILEIPLSPLKNHSLSHHAARILLTDTMKPDIVVAKDGSGQFKTINDALKSVPPKNNCTFVIFIKAGVYDECVLVPRKMNKVVFIGEGPTKTRITGNKNYIDGIGTYKTATVAIEGDGFLARDIGFENTAGPEKHQAVALRVSADMTIFYNCHMDAYQDTLYTHSYRQYYRDCTISGTIDFIFGDAAAVFQNCKMVVRKPLENQACMVTAQGRKDHLEISGLVLQNCSILPDPALESTNPPVKVFLGRPWKDFSRTIIMQSYIDGFISPEGWAPWNGEFALDSCWYVEYQNRGPGASTSGRVNWRGYKKDISPQMLQSFTPGMFFEGDTWIKPSGIPYESGMMPVM